MVNVVEQNVEEKFCGSGMLASPSQIHLLTVKSQTGLSSILLEKLSRTMLQPVYIKVHLTV